MARSPKPERSPWATSKKFRQNKWENKTALLQKACFVLLAEGKAAFRPAPNMPDACRKATRRFYAEKRPRAQGLVAQPRKAAPDRDRAFKTGRREQCVFPPRPSEESKGMLKRPEMGNDHPGTCKPCLAALQGLLCALHLLPLVCKLLLEFLRNKSLATRDLGLDAKKDNL